MGGVSCTPPQAPVDPTMYTITFDSGVESISVEEGAVAKEPAKPTKDGYTFVEWLSGETAYDWTAPVTGNLTLTAKWAVEKYTIDYKLPEGSTNDESNLVEYTIESETISELKDPKLPEGLTFLGWYTDENCTVAFESIEKGSTRNVVIYAKYTDKQTFTVTYYIGDKANTKLEEKDAVFTLTGYDLFTDKEGTKAYKDPITSDITLYAKVKKMTVKFNSNGGSAVEDAKVDYNTAVAKPTDPTLAGSTFQGWTLDGKAYDFNAKVTKDITLTATWKPNAAEKPQEPTTPTNPTTVAVTKNEDGSFSFADGTYTFVLEGDNPVLKFSMPEDVPCTVGDVLKMSGKINLGDNAVYKQLYIQTDDTAGIPLFGFNMLTDWSNGLSGEKNLNVSIKIPETIEKKPYCELFKDCKFSLDVPLTENDKTIIDVTLKDVKLTYEKYDPATAVKTIFSSDKGTMGNASYGTAEVVPEDGADVAHIVAGDWMKGVYTFKEPINISGKKVKITIKVGAKYTQGDNLFKLIFASDDTHQSEITANDGNNKGWCDPLTDEYTEFIATDIWTAHEIENPADLTNITKIIINPQSGKGDIWIKNIEFVD